MVAMWEWEQEYQLLGEVLWVGKLIQGLFLSQPGCSGSLRLWGLSCPEIKAALAGCGSGVHQE